MEGHKTGRTDRRTERPYFIGPFQLLAVVQKANKRTEEQN